MGRLVKIGKSTAPRSFGTGGEKLVGKENNFITLNEYNSKKFSNYNAAVPEGMDRTEFDTAVRNHYINTLQSANGTSSIRSNPQAGSMRLEELNAEKNRLTQRASALRSANQGGIMTFTRANESNAARLRELTNQIKEIDAQIESYQREATAEQRKALDAQRDYAWQQIDQLNQDIRRSSNLEITALQAPYLLPQAVDIAQERETQKELQNQIAGHRRDIERVNYTGKYLGTSRNDNFIGQFQASYDVGQMGQDEAMAWHEYLVNPTDQNRKYADAISQIKLDYIQRNAAALDDDATLPWLSQSLAGYLPQFKGQTIAGAKGALAGGAIASAIPVVGTAAGAKIGYTVGRAKYGFETTQGMVFKSLLDAGVEEETARKAALDEAVISSFIEGGDAVVDMLTLGIGTGISALLKGTAGEAAKSTGKKIASALAKYGINVAEEGAQEWLQEGVSIANQKRNDSGMLNLLSSSAQQISSALSGRDPEGLAQMNQAGLEGVKVAAMMSGASMLGSRMMQGAGNALHAQQMSVDHRNDLDQRQPAPSASGQAASDSTAPGSTLPVYAQQKTASTGETGNRGIIPFSTQEAQNLTSNKGVVNGLGGTFRQFIDNARSLGNTVRFYFGKASESLGKRIESAIGQNVSGYNIAIRSDEVLHALAKHGDAAAEARMGQLPVTPDALERLPEVFDQPDEVVLLPKKDYAGRTAFEIRKQLDGYMVAVVGVANGRHSIEIDSVRITNKKGSPTTTNAAQKASPGLTPETSSRQTLSSGTSIAQDVPVDNIQSVPNEPVMMPVAGENDVAGETRVDGGSVGAMRSNYIHRQKNSKVGSNSFSQMYQTALDTLNENGGNVTELPYDVVTERQSVDNAMQRLFTDLEGEIQDLPIRDEWSGEDLDTAMGILDRYMAEAIESGDPSKVNEWAKLIQSKGTRAGQMIQAFAKYTRTPQGALIDAVNTLENSKLSPERQAEILRYVQEQAQAFEQIQEGDTQALIDLIRRNSEIRRTGSLIGNKLSKQLNAALEADSYEHLRDVALSQIYSIANDYQPRSAAERLRAARQMFMLSNITTVLRNIGGNQIFDPIDSFAGNTFMAPLDMLLSKFTGTRSVAAENPFSITKWKGALNNAMRSYIEVALDVNTDGAQNRYDQTSSRTFKMMGGPLERLLSTWAKYQGYALNTTDEFAKGGIQAETQRRIDTLIDRGLIKDDTLNTRGQEQAEYRTFQDDTRLSRAMLQARNALNNIGPDGFGAGDLVMPFARVPANLATRSVEYSPLGLANGMVKLIGVLQKAHDGTLTAAEQARAVSDIGRGLTGTGLIAAFGALAAAGLIRVAGNGEGEEDKTALEASEGISGTQLNLSGALRWLNGEENALEWRDGDQLMSIGFLEPLNAQMTTGALLAQELDGTEGFGEKNLQRLKSSFEGTLQSLMDLPAMSSLQDLVNGYTYSDADTTGGKVADALVGYGASQVSSFVPNFVRALAKASDPYVRDAYSSGTTAGETLDNIKMSIPVLRQTLPIKQTPFGEDRTYGENQTMNALNALLLPGAITEYRTSDAAQELYRLPTVEDTPVYPRRSAPNSVSAGGTSYPLTAEQKTQYQKTYGQTYQSMINDLTGQSVYQGASDEDTAKMLNMAREYASEQAKANLLSGQGVSYQPEGWIGGAMRTGVPAAPYLLYRFTADADGNGTISQGESGAALLPIRDLSNAQKGAVWQSQDSNWSTEKNPFTGTLAKAGVSPDRAVEILEKYGELSRSDMDAREQQTELSKFFDSLNLTADQRAAADDAFTFYTMIPAKVNPYSIETMSDAAQKKWPEAREWGLSEEQYLKFYPIYSASGKGLTKEVKIEQMVQAGMSRQTAEDFWDLMGD